jgi:Mg/Co/Ni transporter MgtE
MDHKEIKDNDNKCDECGIDGCILVHKVRAVTWLSIMTPDVWKYVFNNKLSDIEIFDLLTKMKQKRIDDALKHMDNKWKNIFINLDLEIEQILPLYRKSTTIRTYISDEQQRILSLPVAERAEIMRNKKLMKKYLFIEMSAKNIIHMMEGLMTEEKKLFLIDMTNNMCQSIIEHMDCDELVKILATIDSPMENETLYEMLKKIIDMKKYECDPVQ